MARIVDEENDWDHNAEGDAVEGPVDCVGRYEMIHALNGMKTGKKINHTGGFPRSVQVLT